MPTPRVLGVDDFCLCRRRSYGAIRIDLERRVPIDLLPDRDVQKMVAGPSRCADHQPGSRRLVCEIWARLGAPKARQVAARWHLLKNLSETMQSFFLSKQSLLKSLIQKSAAEAPPEAKPPELAPWHTGMTKRQEEKSQRLHQQRVELYHQIQDLAAKKIDVANIARKLGVSRQTVYTYLHMKQPAGRTRIHQGGKRLIDPYKEYLVGRWNEGCRSVLLRGIKF